jgi:hypothetical protein
LTLSKCNRNTAPEMQWCHRTHAECKHMVPEGAGTDFILTKSAPRACDSRLRARVRGRLGFRRVQRKALVDIEHSGSSRLAGSPARTGLARVFPPTHTGMGCGSTHLPALDRHSARGRFLLPISGVLQAVGSRRWDCLRTFLRRGLTSRGSSTSRNSPYPSFPPRCMPLMEIVVGR